ncbi:hypothetical protein V8F06_010713 [Rhypophila decipiens]
MFASAPSPSPAFLIVLLLFLNAQKSGSSWVLPSRRAVVEMAPASPSITMGAAIAIGTIELARTASMVASFIFLCVCVCK